MTLSIITKRAGTAVLATSALVGTLLAGPAGAAPADVASATSASGQAAVAGDAAMSVRALAAEAVQPMWWTYRRGDRDLPTPGAGSQNVHAIQFLLRAHGARITADGVFGAHTERAVRVFQRSAHLQVDGIVGPHTWRHLIVTVRQGSHGPAVRAVQRNLRVLGAVSHRPRIDGVFGPQTDRAVREFQRYAGLQVDGIVGPHTWHALVGAVGRADV